MNAKDKALEIVGDFAIHYPLCRQEDTNLMCSQRGTPDDDQVTWQPIHASNALETAFASALTEFAADATKAERTRIVEEFATSRCPYCAGTAIKAGAGWDVVGIEPAARQDHGTILPSSGRRTSFFEWEHPVAATREGERRLWMMRCGASRLREFVFASAIAAPDDAKESE